MKRIACLSLAAMLWPVSLPAVTHLGESEKRTLELTPAVVLVAVSYKATAEWQFGDTPGKLEVGFTETGSGFIYRPDGYVITNGHVVAHANLKDAQAKQDLEDGIKREILARRLFPAFEQQLKRPLTDVEKYKLMQLIHISYTIPDLKVYLANRKEFNADIKSYSDPITKGGKDVAVLKIDATNLPTVRLGNSDGVHIQDAMTVIGYPGAASPLGLSLIGGESLFVPTVTNGHVSAIKTDYKGTPVIQSDAAITHGNSGGPAFNMAGEVIGIATFGPEVAGFNFFVPINTAWEFVRSAGTTPQSGLFNKIWSEALDDMQAGRCETAKGKFTDVLRIIPNEPDALRLSAAAEACVIAMPWYSRLLERNPWAPYVAGGLIVILALFFLLQRRAPAKAVAVPATAGGNARVAMPAELPVAGAPSSFGSVQITSGAQAGQRFKITKEGLLIGRDSAKCQIVLSEDTVSKEHAWIVPIDRGVVVIDRGSANGTYVNSVDSPRVSKIGLQNGDRVYIGKKGTVLTYFSS